MTFEAGVVLQGVDPPEEFTSAASRVEELGYRHLWLTDSSLHARSPYPYLTLAAQATTSLELGTAVTNPLTRHPAVTAVSIATVDEISGHRTMLGIGAGDRPVEALGYGPAKLQQMREAVAATRRLLAGEHVDLDGDGFQLEDAHLRFAARADLPIFMSASGPKMLALAGEIADGVIVLAGLFEAGIQFALEQIDGGARRVGRASRPHVAVMAYGAVDEDEDAALEQARTIAAWFPQTAPRYCELAGLDPDLVEEVRDRYSGGEFQEAAQAAQLLPPKFIRNVAISGNRERIAVQLRRAAEWDIDSVHVFPLGEDRMSTVGAFMDAWEMIT